MISSFRNQATKDIFNGKNTYATRKTCPQKLWKIAVRRLDQLDSINTLDELRIPPGNRFESLSGNRNAQYSIRINEQYRICFMWVNNSAHNVEIIDYH